MQVIEEIAEEGSSFYPTIYFYMEDGDPLTPDTLNWSLKDINGNTINNREQVQVNSPGNHIHLSLGGDDLKVDGNDIAARVITLWGTYTSAVYGAGRPFLFQVKFNVQPKVGG